MSGERWLLVCQVLLLVGMLAYGLWGYEQLPERHPTRFDLTGEPTEWADRSVWHVLMMPLIYAGLIVIGLLAVRYPQMANFPDKERVRALPPERRTPVYAFLRTGLLTLFLYVGVIMAAVQQSLVQSAMTGRMGHALIVIVVLSVGSFVPIAWLLYGLHRRTQQALQASAEDQAA